jgi:hypothetical protein
MMMMMMRVLLLCALCTPALAIDLDSSQLQDVIDAAATRVHESGKWQQLNALGAVDGGALGFINVATWYDTLAGTHPGATRYMR